MIIKNKLTLRISHYVIALGVLGFWGIGSSQLSARQTSVGETVQLVPEFKALLPEGASIEILASGFKWSEGPVWMADWGCLLFSDIPRNRIMRWSPTDGLKIWKDDQSLEGGPGSNGLCVDQQGKLLLCQSSKRMVSRMNEDGEIHPLADRFDGKRFNSPNDLIVHPSGDIYFTDPHYGLPQGENDPSRELDWFGVYRINQADQSVSLVSKKLVRPNGIAFSPDGKVLYVAQSDQSKAMIYAFDIGEDGDVSEARVFFDMTPWVKTGKGLPDGMVIDIHGNLWATGPGGVWVISPKGVALGKILTGEATANCTFGGDGSTLYMTANMHLMRIQTSTRGLGFEKAKE